MDAALTHPCPNWQRYLALEAERLGLIDGDLDLDEDRYDQVRAEQELLRREMGEERFQRLREWA